MTTFEVVLHADGTTRVADIVDVTDRGARVRLEFGNLEPDSTVSMNIRGRAHTARVVWNKKGEAGLEFDRLLPLDVQSTINRSLRRVPTPKRKRFMMG